MKKLILLYTKIHKITYFNWELFNKYAQHRIENVSVYLDKHENGVILWQYLTDALENRFEPFT